MKKTFKLITAVTAGLLFLAGGAQAADNLRLSTSQNNPIKFVDSATKFNLLTRAAGTSGTNSIYGGYVGTNATFLDVSKADNLAVHVRFNLGTNTSAVSLTNVLFTAWKSGDGTHWDPVKLFDWNVPATGTTIRDFTTNIVLLGYPYVIFTVNNSGGEGTCGYVTNLEMWANAK